MIEKTATDIVFEFLTGKRKMDSEVYKAIREQYLIASAIKDKEGKAA